VTDRIFELFSVAATGGTVTKLHPDITEFARDVDPFSAQISPDGSRLIFLANLAETAAAELYSVPIAGGTLTKLNPSFADNSREVQDFGIRISPSSSHVVYTADQETDNVFELFSVPLAGGTSVKLNPTLAGNRSIDGGSVLISSNGEQVIYISDQETNNVDELFIVPITGGTAIKLNPDFTNNNGDIATFPFPLFNSTGTHLVYLADAEIDNQEELFSVSLVCQNDLVVNNDPIAAGNYDAVATITSTGTIENGSAVTFTAGESITLAAGFQVQAGAIFTAAIGDPTCFSVEELTPDDTVERSLLLDSTTEHFNIKTASLIAQPNPFHYETQLRFQLPTAQQVSLHLYDHVGRQVQSIITNQKKEAGKYTFYLRNEQGLSGMYFVVLQTETEQVVQKIMVINN
ncbi:MAG: 3-coathanger stack domain-containing protein, partial [Saprospiraceae bacterium]